MEETGVRGENHRPVGLRNKQNFFKSVSPEEHTNITKIYMTLVDCLFIYVDNVRILCLYCNAAVGRHVVQCCQNCWHFGLI